MKPIIRVKNLSKQYKVRLGKTPFPTFRESIVNSLKSPLKKFGKNNSENFWALRDINFEVEPGEVIGIIGRNGAGKSTILKILSRITEPTKGRIEIYGRVGSLLEVGTGFHPELTGRENIFLNGAILGMKKSEIVKKFDEIVDFAEIEKFIDTPVKHYSSGMYTRLAFAVAANLEPEILVVDEVLAVGDAEFQKKCLGKMKSVSTQEGRTVLFVSHNMSAVSNLCQRAVFLEKGKVEFVGDISEAISLYMERVGTSEVYFADEVVTYAAVKQVGKEIELSVKYEMPIPITMPHLGFSIIDILGNPICGTNPKHDKVPHLPVPQKSGSVQVSVKYPQLIDGTYRLSIWFGTERKDYFEQAECLTFEVLGMVKNQHKNSAAHGYVHPNCKWSFDTI
ncbi:MAG: ABC transporter ATP-binding protein [Acidobacteriota bacterium]|jgi:lipopolysaccharide transport system ATP-binding protein|nr:ABC transporter ATP-binding protein [Acidobacteriota bacterium]